MKSINPELKKYIETEILPQYDVNNIGGHGKEHIQTVIERSFEIINEFELDVNKDMVYTIAAFHDIGYKKIQKNTKKYQALNLKMIKI